MSSSVRCSTATSSNRGTTLVELLVYCGLFLVLLGGVYGLFLASKIYFDQSQDRSALQASVETTVTRMVEELRESTWVSIAVFPNSSAPTAPNGLIFESPRYLTSDAGRGGLYDRDVATGLPIWHKYVCYYAASDPSSPSGQALFRAEIASGASGTTLAGPATWTTADASTLPAATRRLVGANLDSFVASLGSVQALVTLNYSARRNRDSLMVNLDVAMRN